MEFQMNQSKFEDVHGLLDIAEEELKAILFADWHEGEEHQMWLDAAPAEDIAAWVEAMVD